MRFLFRHRSCRLAAAVLVACTTVAATAAAAETSDAATILSAGGLWRKHYTLLPPRLSVEAAKTAGLEADASSRAKALAPRCEIDLVTAPPPADWREVGFDDGDWHQDIGGEFSAGDGRIPADWPLPVARCTDPFVPEVGLVAMRGKFVVKDPGKVARLTLALAYRGGFAAYLNGKEVARAHLPPGPLAHDTPAEAYPLDAFFAPPDDQGQRVPWHWWTHKEESFRAGWVKRERQAGPITIDPALLRTGTNVLAIEFHRTEYPAECCDKKVGLCFATLGLATLRLEADAPPDGVAGPAARPPGISAWNRPIHEPVYALDGADPAEPLGPIRLAGARNGEFSSQVVVGSAAAIEGLDVRASDLVAAAGKAKIPAAAVRVRFAALNPTQGGCEFHYRRRAGVTVPRFDMLSDAPPALVEPFAAGAVDAAVRREMDLPPQCPAAAVVPVWVTVRVPKDAAPGTYAGTLTIAAKGSEPVKVPVELAVADWTLPDRKDYDGLVFIYQSPDTLAEYYKVPRWSEAHWRLIERSLELMGRAGNIGFIFPLLARTRTGNVESMVPWMKKDGGGWDYDFTHFDRYLRTALKHHDRERIRVVAVNVWGHELDTPHDPAGRLTHKDLRNNLDLREKSVRGALVTVVDPKTGARTEMRLPDYARPEAEGLLGPLLAAVRERLAREGLDRCMMIGMSDDGDPPPEHAALIQRVAPGAPWFRDAHPDAKAIACDPTDRAKVIPVGCNSIVWASPIPDPRTKRHYGWQVDAKHLVLSYNRFGVHHLYLGTFGAPWTYRVWIEATLAYGRNGVGRVGGDFFRFVGPNRLPVDNRYPGSQCFGNTQLLHTTSDLFAPGPDGPLSTVRYENALAGYREAQARVFIEKALLDKARPLPAPLARTCQDLLDGRTDALRLWPLGRSTLGSAGWREQGRRLFAAAAQVAAARK